MNLNYLWEDMEHTLRTKLKHLNRTLQAYQKLNEKTEMAFVCGEIQMVENILKEYFDK